MANSMKQIARIIITISLFSCSGNVHRIGQGKMPNSKSKLFEARMIEENKFIDIEEISNHDYREFVFWSDSCEPALKQLILPDETVWYNAENQDSNLAKYYFSHPQYYDFPVVGVSYEQAIAYCKWREKMLNNWIKLKITKSYPGLCDTSTALSYVTCRLPTKEEWIKAAVNNVDTSKYTLGQVKLNQTNGKPLINTIELYHYNMRTKGNSFFAPKIPIPFSTESGQKNNLGLRNLNGNVSEFVDGGEVMGLNYLTKQNGIPYFNLPYSLESSIPDSQPTSWIGFRCVIIVNEKNWP